MKIDPQLVIEVLGEEVGRTRAEFALELDKKIDSAVVLAALEVLRNQVTDVRQMVEGLQPDAQLRTEIAGMQEAVKAGHDRQIDAEEEFIRMLGEFTDSIDRKLDVLEKLVTEKASVADLEKRDADDASHWDQATVRIEAISETIERHVEALRAAQEQDEAEALNDFTDIVVQRVANLRKDIDAHLAEKLDRADNVAAFEILRGEIEKATDQLSDAISALDMRVTEDDTRSIVADLDGKIDELKRDLELELAERVKHEDSVAAIEDLQKAIEPRIDDILKRLAGIDADMAESDQHTDARVDNVLESWKSQFDDVRNRLRTTMLSVQEWQDETTKEIAKRLAEIKDGEKGEQGEKGLDGRDGVRGDKGEKGDSGDPGRDAVPWDHLGTYDPSKAYRFHDAVMKDGGSFLSMANNNTTVPGESPQWRLMAARGQRGKPGEQGPRGEPGTSVEGPVGPQGEAALPFIEIRAEAEHLIFIREDGEIFETSLLPFVSALRGEFKSFITEQMEIAIGKMLDVVTKAVEGKKTK